MEAPPAAAPDLGPHLIAAADFGNVPQVGALLDQGADIEARDEDGMSALHCASDRGHREVVALLLDRGGDIEAVDNVGWTSVMWASIQGKLEVVQLLHARGANINRTNAAQVNALHLAAFCDRLPVCEFLLSKGVDLMAESIGGRTALRHYGSQSAPALSPDIKAIRCAALVIANIAYWRDVAAANKSTIEALQSENALLKKANNTAPLFSDAFSDLVFVCPGGERIHAHRCIVSASSPYARALLQGPWAENKDERVAVVQMPQSAAAVRALLRFLYTGETDAEEIQASMSDVLELASQHEQPELKAACERHAMAALSVATVVPVLVAAHLHDLVALKAACVALITASVPNMAAVTLSKAFFSLETTHPLLLRELRAALGLPEEEEEQEKEEGQEEEQDRKRARHEN